MASDSFPACSYIRFTAVPACSVFKKPRYTQLVIAKPNAIDPTKMMIRWNLPIGCRGWWKQMLNNGCVFFRYCSQSSHHELPSSKWYDLLASLGTSSAISRSLCVVREWISLIRLDAVPATIASPDYYFSKKRIVSIVCCSNHSLTGRWYADFAVCRNETTLALAFDLVKQTRKFFCDCRRKTRHGEKLWRQHHSDFWSSRDHS